MDERQGGRVRAPRRSRQAGFSYIEVLVGIMILAIVAGGIVQGLAATSKSGRLHVQGPSRSGTIWVDNARLLAAESPTTPHVDGPVDVLFQMLRFERGSFRFEIDKYPPDPGEPLDIDLALGEAEAMLQEWRELEARIPGTDSWVSLAGSLRDV